MRISQLGIILAATTTVLAIPLLSGCRVGYSFRGPGYDVKRGVIHPDAGEKVFVIITQGDIESGSSDKFSKHLQAVMGAMDTHEGLIGYAARKELFGSRVWTMSAWVNREVMLQFTYSGAHQTAVIDGGIPPKAFISASTYVDAADVPIKWTQAQKLLDAVTKEK